MAIGREKTVPRLSGLQRQPAVGASLAQARRTPRRASGNDSCPSSSVSTTFAEQAADETSICVAIRIRPLLPHEAAQREAVRTGEHAVGLCDDRGQDRVFGFDVVLDSRPSIDSGAGRVGRSTGFQTATQNVVYEAIGLPAVRKVLAGYNTCLLAYGHTGSGKTHTVLGEPICRGGSTSSESGVACSFSVAGDAQRQLDPRAPSAGLLPRALEAVFVGLQGEADVQFIASFYEVYNERVQDLLAAVAPAAAPPPPVKEDSGRRRKGQVRPTVHFHPRFGAFIDGLGEVPCTRMEEALQVLATGSFARSTAVTGVNERSSRSHAVFSLRVERSNMTNSLMMVDLAGREQERVMQSAQCSGERFRELTLINRSLFHLANCVRTLAAEGSERAGVNVNGSGQGHHFRNSKLTMLLGHALAGNSHTTVVGTISPGRAAHEDSLATLRFCESVKQVRTRPVINECKEDAVRFLEDEVRRLSTELSRAHTGRQLVEQQLSEAQSMMEHYRTSWRQAMGRSAVVSPREILTERSSVPSGSKMRSSPPRSPGSPQPRAHPQPARRGIQDLLLSDRSVAPSNEHGSDNGGTRPGKLCPSLVGAGDGDAAGGHVVSAQGIKDRYDVWPSGRALSPQRRGVGPAVIAPQGVILSEHAGSAQTFNCSNSCITGSVESMRANCIDIERPIEGDAWMPTTPHNVLPVARAPSAPPFVDGLPQAGDFLAAVADAAAANDAARAAEHRVVALATAAALAGRSPGTSPSPRTACLPGADLGEVDGRLASDGSDAEDGELMRAVEHWLEASGVRSSGTSRIALLDTIQKLRSQLADAHDTDTRHVSRASTQPRRTPPPSARDYSVDAAATAPRGAASGDGGVSSGRRLRLEDRRQPYLTGAPASCSNTARAFVGATTVQASLPLCGPLGVAAGYAVRPGSPLVLRGSPSPRGSVTQCAGSSVSTTATGAATTPRTPVPGGAACVSVMSARRTPRAVIATPPAPPQPTRPVAVEATMPRPCLSPQSVSRSSSPRGCFDARCAAPQSRQFARMPSAPLLSRSAASSSCGCPTPATLVTSSASSTLEALPCSSARAPLRIEAPAKAIAAAPQCVSHCASANSAMWLSAPALAVVPCATETTKLPDPLQASLGESARLSPQASSVQCGPQHAVLSPKAPAPPPAALAAGASVVSPLPSPQPPAPPLDALGASAAGLSGSSPEVRVRLVRSERYLTPGKSRTTREVLHWAMDLALAPGVAAEE